MEDVKKKPELDKRDQEIVYSKAIKAGKRIYYLDVKRNRKDDLFLAITESKKKISGDDAQVSFEKHKIFLYKEDFDKFKEGIEEVIDFINKNNGSTDSLDEETSVDVDTEEEKGTPNKFEIDFG